MPRYLLDTNVFSRLVRGVDHRIWEKVSGHLDYCILSSVVWYELEYGASRSADPNKSRERLALLRSTFPFVYAFGEDDAAEAASVRAYLEMLKPNAQPIGPLDVLLAGHALALDAVLVTNNVREFSRIPHLVIEDWQTPS